MFQKIGKWHLFFPLLKKLGLDIIFENFRPVSNLPFVSKTAEKAVLGQLLDHCTEKCPHFQQTSQLIVNFTRPRLRFCVSQNDILLSMDKQMVTILILLVRFGLIRSFRYVGPWDPCRNFRIGLWYYWGRTQVDYILPYW